MFSAAINYVSQQFGLQDDARTRKIVKGIAVVTLAVPALAILAIVFQRAGLSVVRNGFSMIKSGASVVRSGVSIVTKGALATNASGPNCEAVAGIGVTMMEKGPSVIQMGATMIESGTSMLKLGNRIMELGASIFPSASALVGSTLVGAIAVSELI